MERSLSIYYFINIVKEILYMANQYNYEIDFENWCIKNNRVDLLSLWDYELNNKIPKQISAKTRKKYYFKCPK